MSSPTPPDPERSAGGAGGGSSAGSGSGPSGARPTPPPSSGRAAGGSAGSGSGQGSDATPAIGPDAKPPTPFTQQLGRITIVVLAALFAVFAIANSQRVDFSWVFGETIAREAADGSVTGGVPLILLLVGAFIAGALITFLIELYVGRARRARRAAKERAGQENPKGRKDRGERT